MARAFVRLSLEKKLLADHLRQLLSEAELLRALYKKHAFLRQEDEREQFIYHLESLNVVDYFCFTNHFRSIPTDYSVLLVPSKKFNSSTTSANPYMKLFGSLGESDIFLIPRNNFEFVISVSLFYFFFGPRVLNLNDNKEFLRIKFYNKIFLTRNFLKNVTFS